MNKNCRWSPFEGINGPSSCSKSIYDENFEYRTSRSDLSAEKTQESTLLFNLIKARKWEEACDRVKATPNEAHIWIEKTDMHGSVIFRQLTIHKACEVHPPEKLMEMIIDAHPRGVQLKNSNGDLPLHIACLECTSGNIINLLINHYPGGVKVKNSKGKLPLHLACRQWNDVTLIKNLLVAYSQAAQCADLDGLLPIHFACEEELDVDIIKHLVFAFPDGVGMKDRWGRTPLCIITRKYESKGNQDNMIDSDNDEKKKEAIIRVLKCDLSYWRVNLIDQVKTLTSELEKANEEKKLYFEKANKLEGEFQIMARRISGAAKSFQDKTANLESTRNDLCKKVKKLTSQLDEREQKIGQLIVENMDYKSQVHDMSTRLKALSSILPNIEEQRNEILAMTGRWEDSLRQASKHMVNANTSKNRKLSPKSIHNREDEFISTRSFFSK